MRTAGTMAPLLLVAKKLPYEPKLWLATVAINSVRVRGICSPPERALTMSSTPWQDPH
jgi:hypothetical protein